MSVSSKLSAVKSLPEQYLWYVDDYIHKICSKSTNDFKPYCELTSDCFQKKKEFEKNLTKNDKNENEGKLSISVNANKDISSLIKSVKKQANMFRGTQSEMRNSRSDCCAAFDPESAEALINSGLTFIFSELVNSSQKESEQKIKKHISAMRLHVKWLLCDDELYVKNLPRDREPRYSDIVYIIRSTFEGLLDSYIKSGLNVAKKCSSEITKSILKNRELAIVALFFSQYVFLRDRNTKLTVPLPTREEKVILDIQSQVAKSGLKVAVKKISNARKKIFKSGWGAIFNPHTSEMDLLEIFENPVDDHMIYVSGLLKQYNELNDVLNKKINPDQYPHSVFDLKTSIYSNPIYRQIIGIFGGT